MAGTTQFATDDGSVAGAATTIGDNRGGLFHDRLPVGVRFVGDEHFPFLELVDVMRTLNDPHPTGSDLSRRRCAR